MVRRFGLYALLLSLIAILSLPQAGADEPDGHPPKTESGKLSRGRLVQSEADAKAAEKFAKAADQRISINYDGWSFNDVIVDLTGKLKVPVVLDKVALSEIGIERDSSVSIKLAEITGRAALAHILRRVDPSLTWDVRDEAIVITTRASAEKYLRTRIYDVHDLVTWVDQHQTEHEVSETDYETLIDMITTTVEPDSWDEVGGPGSIAEYQATGLDVLVVVHTREVHEKIADLLISLRQVRDQDALKKGPRRSVGFSVSDSGTGVRSAPGDELQFTERDNENRLAVVAAANQFGCDVYKKIEANDQNLVFSPYSVWTALAMLYGGAKGKSAEELRTALRIDPESGNVHADAEILRINLWWARHFGRQRLIIANRIWGQKDYAFEPAYLELLRTRYAAPLAEVDFQKPQAARESINAWIAEQTDRMIQSAIPPDALNELTRLVLVNTIFFEGKWQKPFDKVTTAAAAFHTGTEEMETAMMYLRETCRYGETDAVQIIEKPYAGNVFSMMLVLPQIGAHTTARNKGDEGLAKLVKLEESLTAEKIDAWRSALKPRETDIYLPRFKFDKSISLKEILAMLGVKRVFEGGPTYNGLAGIAPEPGLFVDFVHHAAVIETDEAGTRAAAVTSAGGGGFLQEPPVPVFRADRPFLFAIRDAKTGVVLFLGRVTRPEKWTGREN